MAAAAQEPALAVDNRNSNIEAEVLQVEEVDQGRREVNEGAEESDNEDEEVLLGIMATAVRQYCVAHPPSSRGESQLRSRRPTSNAWMYVAKLEPPPPPPSGPSLLPYTLPLG